MYGDTALIKAAEEGHTSTVNMLVDLGAAVDIRDEVAILYAPHAQVIVLNVDITIVAYMTNMYRSANSAHDITVAIST